MGYEMTSSLEGITPFKIGDTEIQSVALRKIGFVEFVKATSSASDSKSYQRARMKASLVLDGSSITDEQISLLPIGVGKKLLSELDKMDNSTGGKIVSPEKANGIDSPIVYELGTPLRMKKGDSEIVIKELEFFAKTFGDVEDAMAEGSGLRQAVEILRRIATPLGANLTILPEVLLNQITVIDGVKIAQLVVPPFVE